MKFLLEIYSEDIPARMQNNAARYMQQIIVETLAKEKLNIKKDQAKTLVNCRRISLIIENLDQNLITPAKTIIGPKTSANEKAINGFLKSNNLGNIDELKTLEQKGNFHYLVELPESKIATIDIIKKSIPVIIAKMTNHWPKTMIYSDSKGSKHKWIRPVRNLLCLADDQVVNINLFGHDSSNKTFPHSQKSNQQITIDDAENYLDILMKNNVILDQAQRTSSILDQIAKITKDLDLKTIDGPNSDIFHEINGICEFPTALTGKISEKFMQLPREILILTLKSNQKFLCLENNKGEIDQNFIFFTDAVCDSKFHGNIIQDNEKIGYARLQDANFYIEEDLSESLEQHYQKLDQIVFHEKLGSVKDKTKRIENLAEFISLWIPHCPIGLIQEAAKFSKADLVTKTVAEFTSLQGNIGAYFAQKQNHDDQVCEAIYEHYLPTGNKSSLPSSPLGAAIATSDKVDTITGFFLANQKPTSSKDPFALRRSAIGVLKICIQHNIKIPFRALISKSLNLYKPKVIKSLLQDKSDYKLVEAKKILTKEIVTFFLERLKNLLKEDYGYNSDIVNNIIDDYIENITDHKYCDVINLISRVEFVNNLANDSKYKNLIEVYKRSYNALSAEEKKDNKKYDQKPHFFTLKKKEEKILYKKVKKISVQYKKLVRKAEFSEAFDLLLEIHNPLEDFFDNVMVNDKNIKLRENRLAILAQIRSLFSMLGDLSKIEFKK